MRNPMLRWSALAALGLAVSGCQIDDIMYRVPWFGNMHRQASVKPYEQAPRALPEGTVPVSGSEGDWQLFDAATVDRLVNPRARTAESLTRGEELYDVYCLVCHGATGAGDGPVKPLIPVIPSLLTDRARGYSEGYLYSIIRYGRGLMPRYGDRIRKFEDRWDVVNYVRQLQAGEAR